MVNARVGLVDQVGVRVGGRGVVVVGSGHVEGVVDDGVNVQNKELRAEGESQGDYM